jgi:hypothetical protein
MQAAKKRRIALAGVMQFFCPENASVVCFIWVVRVCPKKKRAGVQPGPFCQKSFLNATLT